MIKQKKNQIQIKNNKKCSITKIKFPKLYSNSLKAFWLQATCYVGGGGASWEWVISIRGQVLLWGMTIGPSFDMMNGLSKCL